MMKKLLLLLFSLLISFNSNGEWKGLIESADGQQSYYVDVDTIKESGRYVYWWDLGDSKKLVGKSLSIKSYGEGDCAVNRYRTLSRILYKQRMGKGKGDRSNPQFQGWTYPVPGSINKAILDFVCDYVN